MKHTKILKINVNKLKQLYCYFIKNNKLPVIIKPIIYERKLQFFHSGYLNNTNKDINIKINDDFLHVLTKLQSYKIVTKHLNLLLEKVTDDICLK